MTDERHTDASPAPIEPVGAISPAEPAIPAKPRQPAWMTKLGEYGRIGLVTYFAIFFSTWSGFAFAMALGVDAEGSAAGAGVIGAAWLATKLTQPLRIAATIVVTPVVAAIWHRLRPKPALKRGEPPDDPYG